MSKKSLLFLLLFIGVASCSPGDDDPAPAPDPAPEPAPEPPPVTVPTPPEGTDFSQPGSHGSVGIDPYDEDDPITDAPVSGVGELGSLEGSSPIEMSRWDKIQKLDKCPESAIYVYASTSEASVAQCADGAGFAGTCDAAQALAQTRAENVVRSCQRVPSCDGTVTAVGQEWQCQHIQGFTDTDPDDGSVTVFPERWQKQCWIQYKVVCLET